MNSEAGFKITFWLLIGTVFCMRVVSAWQIHKAAERLMPDPDTVKREGTSFFITRRLLFLVLSFVLLSYGLRLSWIMGLSIQFPAWLRWLGAILCLVSMAMWVWTQLTLNIHWSSKIQLRPGHRLVTSGSYLHIRHPLYSAIQSWVAGLALLTANWVFIIFAALTLIGLFARVPCEEQRMLMEFGDEYQQYLQKTGRFWPK